MPRTLVADCRNCVINMITPRTFEFTRKKRNYENDILRKNSNFQKSRHGKSMNLWTKSDDDSSK